MKKISSFILTAGAIIVVASCAKELNVAETAPENIKEVNITVIASEKPEVEAETKTFIDGTSVKWSNSGEKLKVFEVATPSEGDAVTSQTTSAEGVTTDSGATMSFGVTVEDKSGDNYASFDYYAFYPSSAYQSYTSVNAVAINTKGAQTPSATNFDASQDLLIAKKIENGTDQASTLEMQFARVVAIGKMTIKNLETTDPITKITFSAKVGGEDVALAGRTNFNLETAKPVSTYASNTQDHAIILDYEGQNITANTSEGMVAYFTCYPFAINATTPGSFKVVVETATESFAKEVNVSSAKGLAFNIGKASVFSVDMDGITGEVKAVDLRYAYLDYDDYTTAGGTNSYANVTVDKTHGDSWVTFVATSNNAIGLGNASGSNANAKASYIKLPDFEETINSVVITLRSAPASATSILLQSSNSGTSGDLANISSSSNLVYTIDISSSSVNTAYLRSNGAQLLIDKIEVYAGEDNRTAIAAPSSVTAALNNDDANVTNSIDVSWSAVDGAVGYLITLSPDSGEDVVVNASSNPYTVTGLQYDMDYLVSVQAVPDYYINKISAQTTAPDVVTTGSELVGGSYWELVSSFSAITAGDKYLLATNDKNNVFNGTISSGHLQVVAVSPMNGKIFDDDLPASASKIDFISATGSNKYYLKVGNQYISAKAAASGNFELSDNAFEWTFSGTNGMNALGTAQAAYIRSYNNNSFRSYANTSNGAVFFLYKLVDNDTRSVVTLAFAEDEYEFVVNSDDYNAFTPQVATADPNVAAITSAITYALNDPNGVVTGFSTSTGAFTLTGNTGTATITASYAGDANNYKPAAAVSYTVTVKPAGGSVTFMPYDFSGLGTANTGSEMSVTKDGITFSDTKGYGTTEIRCYANGTLTISATGGKTITGLSFTFSGTKTGGMDTSYSNLSTTSWEFDHSSQARITELIVYYN